MSSKTKSAGTSIGLGGLIFLIFLTLKLAGIGEVATWSWWWVTSPLWIPFVIVIGILLFILVFSLIALGIAFLLGTTVTLPDWLKSKIEKK